MDSANSRLNNLESAYLLNAAILNISNKTLVGEKNQFYQWKKWNSSIVKSITMGITGSSPTS